MCNDSHRQSLTCTTAVIPPASLIADIAHRDLKLDNIMLAPTPADPLVIKAGTRRLLTAGDRLWVVCGQGQGHAGDADRVRHAVVHGCGARGVSRQRPRCWPTTARTARSATSGAPASSSTRCTPMVVHVGQCVQGGGCMFWAYEFQSGLKKVADSISAFRA